MSTGGSSNVDIHICGACKAQFHDVELFLIHKRQSCPLLSKPATKQVHVENQPQLQSQPQIQSQPTIVESIPTAHAQSHGAQNDTSTDVVPYMVTPITPPLGHEYVQTVQKPRSTKPQFLNHVLVTDKGELIIVQDKSNLAYDESFYQQHGENLLSVIQQQLVQNTQPQVQPQVQTTVQAQVQNQVQVQAAQDGRPEQVIFTNGAETAQEQTQVFQQEVSQDNSAPRMQLDHNGSYSLVPSSQIPANLQLSVNSQQQPQLPGSHVVSGETAADGQQAANQHLVLKQLLNSSQNQAIIQQFQQQQQQQQQQLQQQQQQQQLHVQQLHVQQQQQQQQQQHQLQQQQQHFGSTQVPDLAQQAAAISGVEPGFPNLPAEITSSEQIDNQQYSVHIRTVNQPSSEVSAAIENVMHVQEPFVSEVQDNTVSGTQQQDVTNIQEFDEDVTSSQQPSLDSARQMLLSSIASSQKWKLHREYVPKKPKRIRPKKFKCDFNGTCTFKSSFQKDLDRHMRTHTGEKPYSCEYCNKGFGRLDKLKLHIRGHTGDKPFKCLLCDYSSVDSSGLKKHSVTHTRDRKHKCQVCPYACRSASQLTVHLRVHTGDTPFPCPFCPSKFKIKSDLRRHIRVHTGEKPYVCDECGVKCATNGNLASHIRVHHSQDKQIKCQQCDFSSSSKRVLREHIKSHEPENPDTTCPICDYQCANKEVLKNHLVTHKTEKEFVCSYCNFSTKHKANLVIHIRRKHINILSKKTNKEKQQGEKSPKTARIKIGNTYSKRFEKQFHCDLCDESFVRKDSLNSHKRLHEEMAKSTLSTALTVLRLQQPVINVTTSQTDPASTAPSGSRNGELNKKRTENTSSGIENISIIEKQGSINTEDNIVNVDAELTDQAVLTSATTPIQSAENTEVVLSDNFQQQLSRSSNSVQLQLESNIIQENIEEARPEMGICDNSYQDSQSSETLVTSTSIPVQTDVINNGQTTVENVDISQPNASVMINLEGQGQPTVNHQNSDTGNSPTLNNQTLGNNPNSIPLPTQMCQIPSIQLVQNISFPLFRLPGGQLISAFNGQPSPQLINNSAQGTSPGDIQLPQNISVPQQIPVQIVPTNESPNFYPGTGQLIDSNGQPIQSPMQLVLTTSAANTPAGNQSVTALPENSVQEVTSSTPEICTTVDNQRTRDQTNVLTLPIRTDMVNQSTQEENVVQQI